MTFMCCTKRSSVVLGLLFIVLLFFCSSFAYAATAPVGQMVWVKGSVRAITPTHQVRVLQRRSAVYEQDTIVTGASGSGQLIFTDNSVVVLRNNTTFKVDQYKFNQGSHTNAYISSLIKGGLRIITGLISKSNPENYRVRTPVATIGVRGTDFTIFYSVSTGLSTSLAEGAIIIANQAGQIELNTAKNRVYAEIASVHNKPVLKQVPSPTLKGQPNATAATLLPSPPPPPSDGGGSPPPPPAAGGGSGGDGSGGAASTTEPSSTSINPPAGPARSVSGFCIQ